jgi:TRAP-type C4-dicarboxylate transport system substrate-binding protein
MIRTVTKALVIVGVASSLSMGTALAGGHGATVEGPKVFWKLSTWGNPRAFTKGIEHLSEQLAKKTGGNFTLKIFYGGQLSKNKENLDGLKANAFEMATFCNFYHPGKNPALMVMTMPFLPVKDFDSAARVRRGLYEHPIVKEEMAKWNAMYYESSHLPQYEFVGKGEAPMTLEGFKGMRVRAGGGVGVAMEVLGATRQSMPAPEVYTAMQRGTVDAASFPFSYAHGAYKTFEIGDWFTSNLSPGTSDCPIVVNKTAFDNLPKQYQDLMMGMRDEVMEVYRNAYKAADEKYLPMFRAKLKEITYSDAELARFQELGGRPVWDKWVADNKDKFDAQAILDLTLKLAKGE